MSAGFTHPLSLNTLQFNSIIIFNMNVRRLYLCDPKLVGKKKTAVRFLIVMENNLQLMIIFIID